MWNEIDVTDAHYMTFDPNSTYIQNPSFFQGLSKEPGTIEPLKDLRVMGNLAILLRLTIFLPVQSVKTHQLVNIY